MPEYISVEGLREDGRRANELRRVEANVGMFPHADGSAYFQQGDTKVVAIVNGPKQGVGKAGDAGKVVCDFEMAAFSTTQRRKPLRLDRKNAELGSKIASTFESAIMTDLYPRSQIEISVQVLQADGGVLAVAINAVTLALMDAGVAMTDFVCACTASVIDGTNVLDINHYEASAQGPELTIAVLPSSSTIVMAEMKSRVHGDLYAGLQDLAIVGGTTLLPLLKKAVHDRTRAMLPCLGPAA
ncbi:hypothetical protein PTSG_06814 [Salpingoeca rosetta]|uniref:Uncharacterized protein n=1 Tax=Salpingoeca rosetta (strain ATCC 50818 / BSB-021) TaxID=946362 RepID=F2UEW1_SALR5|nr:uncharacterized protein PTSG_06814 [Salpingoeca rosetta]EGD75161.1 hypothetical protein PTSG_06814 [Salpingoeca rosetta]|eukprot:XP_004992214.1 hypothetical protein PTSG_06814 [Salpingoeca rosetta]